MKAHDLIAELRGIDRHPIRVTVITAADHEVGTAAGVAVARAQLQNLPQDPYGGFNPLYPPDPDIYRDHPPIIIEPGREAPDDHTGNDLGR